MLLRLWVRHRGQNYVGECLEVGVHVEGDTLEETVALLQDAVEAWEEGAQSILDDGERLGILPVRWYWPKLALWEISMFIHQYRTHRRSWLKEERVTISAPVRMA